MAVGPQGVALFVGTRKTKVYVVTDRDRNFVGDEVKEFRTARVSPRTGSCSSSSRTAS